MLLRKNKSQGSEVKGFCLKTVSSQLLGTEVINKTEMRTGSTKCQEIVGKIQFSFS